MNSHKLLNDQTNTHRHLIQVLKMDKITKITRTKLHSSEYSGRHYDLFKGQNYIHLNIQGDTMTYSKDKITFIWIFRATLWPIQVTYKRLYMTCLHVWHIHNGKACFCTRQSQRGALIWLQGLTLSGRMQRRTSIFWKEPSRSFHSPGRDSVWGSWEEKGEEIYFILLNGIFKMCIFH